MKKSYQSSSICIVHVDSELPISASNTLYEDSINFNPDTMDGGDGSDAVKSNSYSVWEDDWNH